MDISTLISTVGFPIAACAAMAYYVATVEQRQTESLTKLENIISANTCALNALTNALKGGGLV